MAAIDLKHKSEPLGRVKYLGHTCFLILKPATPFDAQMASYRTKNFIEGISRVFPCYFHNRTA